MSTKTKVEKVITRAELKEILLGVNSPKFISMKTKTEVGMNKYTNFWIEDENGNKVRNSNRVPWKRGPVYKVSKKISLITGFNYETSVNGRLVREGKEPNFKPGEGQFKQLSKGLVTDKKTESKFYVRYQRMKSSTVNTEYVPSDGNPIELAMFKNWMKSKSENTNQGLDNPLNYEVCNLDNVLEITINGCHYTLTN